MGNMDVSICVLIGKLFKFSVRILIHSWFVFIKYRDWSFMLNGSFEWLVSIVNIFGRCFVKFLQYLGFVIIF